MKDFSITPLNIIREQRVNREWQYYNGGIIQGHSIPLNHSHVISTAQARQLTGYSEAGHRTKQTAALLQLNRPCTCFYNSCAFLSVWNVLFFPPLKEGTFLPKHKSEDAAIVHSNTALIIAQLLGTTEMQSSITEETKPLCTRAGRFKDFSSLEHLSGCQEKQPENLNLFPHTRFLILPPCLLSIP